jgi:hypothetical protein
VETRRSDDAVGTAYDPTMRYIEINAKGPNAVTVTDQFFKEAQAAGYTPRVGPGIEKLGSDGATFAVDIGDKDRGEAQAEIETLIAGITDGTDTLSIEPLLPKN